MAGIILYNANKIDEEIIRNARNTFHQKVEKHFESKYELGSFVLYYYRKSNYSSDQVFTNEKGDTLCVSGSILYKGKTGTNALKVILQEINKGKELVDFVFSGNYILIAFINGKLQLMRDLFGGLVCYTNHDQNWFTTNFLSAVSLIEKKVYKQHELLEYLLYGFVFGDTTIIEGLNIISSSKVLELTSNQKLTKRISIPPIENNYNKCLSNNLDVLKSEFDQYKKAYGDNVISALSGGYDSRLMLALILDAGIKPNLYVYGSNNHPEVTVAKEITKNEGIDLLHINKQKYNQVPINDFNEVMNKNLWGLDGFVNVGIIGNNSDLFERINRGESNGGLLNGAGGEIYRDVWQWNFKNTSIANLISANYNTGELTYLGINQKEFFLRIEDKLISKFKDYFPLGKKISRQQAEYVFPIYRGNFYYTNNIINNYFSNSILPFMSEPVVLEGLSIPTRFKYNGKFEMDLIKKINSTLASYKSSYGYDFVNGLNSKQKLINNIYRNLPPNYKSTLKRMSGKSKKSLFSAGPIKQQYIDNSYLSSILDLKNLQINSVIGDLKIENQQILNRIFSMELLSQRFNISFEK